MKQYLVEIEDASGAIQKCVAMEAGDAGLGLAQSGVTWREPADVRIEIEHDELCVVTDNEDICIERNGRSRMLSGRGPVRILKGDRIRVNGRKFCVHGVYRGDEGSSSLRDKLRVVGKTVMMTMASAMLLTACNGTSVKVEPLAGDVARVDPVAEQEMLVAQCMHLEGDEKTACCEKLQTTRGFSCPEAPKEELHPEHPSEVETGHHGAIRQTPCFGMAPEEMKACCEGLDAAELREGCCTHLERHTSLKCEVPKEARADRLSGAIAVLPYEGRRGADLKAHCEQMKDENEREECCDYLKEESGQKLTCEAGKKVEPKPLAGKPKPLAGK